MRKKRDLVQPDFFELPMNVQNAFRTLCSNIQFAGIDKPIQTIVVTSCPPFAGKSMVAVSLALAMAEQGKCTLIVDADCRQPMVGNRLQFHPKHTWLDVLFKELPLDEAISAVPEHKNLFLLDTESDTAHSSEILGSQRFRTLADELKKRFDVVIFDTPPLGTFIDAALLASYADGTLYVVRAGATNIRQEQDCIDQLKRANANLLGTVLNDVRTSRRKDNYYYYYYKDGHKSRRKREKTT